MKTVDSVEVKEDGSERLEVRSSNHDGSTREVKRSVTMSTRDGEVNLCKQNSNVHHNLLRFHHCAARLTRALNISSEQKLMFLL